MSSFKTYARQAKQRLRNNFWGEIILERKEFKQMEQGGANTQGLLVKQKQEIRDIKSILRKNQKIRNMENYITKN